MEPITAEFAKFKEEIFLVQSDINSAFYERATNKLEDLVAKYPDRAEPYAELGKIAYNFRNHAEAERNLLLAIQADPDYFPPYLQYAVILIRERRFEAAENLLKSAESLRHSESAELYFYFGLLYQHQENFTTAIAYFSKSLRCSFNDTQAKPALDFIRNCQELMALKSV